MKKFLYNTERTESINKYIQDNLDLFKERFGDKFEFIVDYPFVLSYPKVEYVVAEFCECCGQRIPQKPYEWVDGYRPEMKDIRIDLNIIAQILETSRVISETSLKEEFNEFIVKFKKYFCS